MGSLKAYNPETQQWEKVSNNNTNQPVVFDPVKAGFDWNQVTTKLHGQTISITPENSAMFDAIKNHQSIIVEPNGATCSWLSTKTLLAGNKLIFTWCTSNRTHSYELSIMPGSQIATLSRVPVVTKADAVTIGGGKAEPGGYENGKPVYIDGAGTFFVKDQIALATAPFDESFTEPVSVNTEGKLVVKKAIDKLDKNQGAENSGKILGISADGNVLPVEKPSGGNLPLEPLTFTGGANGEYDGTKPLTVDIPTGGGGGSGFNPQLLWEIETDGVTITYQNTEVEFTDGIYYVICSGLCSEGGKVRLQSWIGTETNAVDKVTPIICDFITDIGIYGVNYNLIINMFMINNNSYTPLSLDSYVNRQSELHPPVKQIKTNKGVTFGRQTFTQNIAPKGLTYSLWRLM